MKSFLSFAPAEVIKPIIQGIAVKQGKDAVAENLLINNLMSQERIESIASLIAPGDDWSSMGDVISKLHLAHPLISSKKIEELLDRLPAESTANAALMANPNCPKARIVTNWFSEANTRNYQEALSSYGDLDDPRTMEALDDLFVKTIPQPTHDKELLTRHRDHCLIRLASRQDLTEDLAKRIDSVASPMVFGRLVKSLAHRELVSAGTLTGMNQKDIGDPWLLVLSPEVTTVRLGSYFNVPGNRDYSTRRILATHQNATLDMIMDIIEKNEPGTADKLATQLVTTQSPHASKALAAIKKKFPNNPFPSNIGSLNIVGSEMLETAFDESRVRGDLVQCTKIMCNPRFPWQRHQNDLAAMKPEGEREGWVSALASKVQAGYLTNDDFTDAMTDIDTASAVLFAPNISSHRLGKLASRHPDLVPLAAVHPNGFDIPTKNLSSEAQAVVESARYTPLAGHSSSQWQNQEPQVLTI